MKKRLIIVSGYFNPLHAGHIEYFTLAKKFGDHKTYNIFFANGGDQKNNMIPEATTCHELGIELIDKLGKKIQSSSWLLNK